MKQIFTKCALLVALLSVGMSAFAYDFEKYGFYFHITSTTNNTVELTYMDENYNSYSGDLTLLGSVNYNNVKYTVTAIGEKAFKACSDLTSLTIPASVTSIGGDAFADTKTLETVTFEEGSALKSIAGGAFVGSGIKSISLPDGVTDIGGSIFLWCTNLTSVKLSSGITTIPDGTFAYCTSLTTYEIPSTVTTLSTNAFLGTGLTSIVIPNNVTTLGENVFAECSSLSDVTIGSGLSSIGKKMFRACNSLVTLNIPANITKIEGDAFADTKALETVIFAKECVLNTIEAGSFVASTLKYIDLPEGLSVIPENTFVWCGSLESVTLPSTITSIGDYAFHGSIMTSFTIKATMPPSASNCSLQNRKNEVTVYVPKGSLDTYKADGYWSQFTLVEKELTTDIKNISADDVNVWTDVYSLSGQKVFSGKIADMKVPAGIYIVKTGDQTKKICVR